MTTEVLTSDKGRIIFSISVFYPHDPTRDILTVSESSSLPGVGNPSARGRVDEADVTPSRASSSAQRWHSRDLTHTPRGAVRAGPQDRNQTKT